MKKKNLLIAVLSVAMLVSCGTKPAASSTEGGNSETSQSQQQGNDVFSITTDLEEEKEIHTDAQLAYLQYEGQYKTIDPNLYPNGNGALSDSDPKPVKIEWEYEVDESEELQYYSVEFSQNEDLSNPYYIKGSKNKSIDLYNVYIGKNYFKVTANYKGGAYEESNIYSFNVKADGPRNLSIDGMTNCRDMGGKTLISGGKIKQGLIFRTSGVVGNYPAQATDAGISTLKDQLKVKTDINVSDGSQYNGTNKGWNVVDCFMNYNQGSESTNHHFSRNAESVKKVFSLLADENNYPLFYHCRIGTDRTGLTAILINGLLGLEENLIYQDYLYSNFGKIGEKRYIGEKAGQDNIEKYMEEIAAMPGANWAQKTYNALLAIGVPAATLNKVINFLTEGDTVTGNDNGQLIGMGDALTGGTKKTSSDRNNPAEYYTLANGASLTYNFTTASAYNAYFTGYLGLSSASTSNKLSGAIKVELDGTELTVANKTYFQCGFGNINGRVCYYYNCIGEKEALAAGAHTLKITAKTNNLNVGALGVFKK